jgi:hypothetical protein
MRLSVRRWPTSLGQICTANSLASTSDLNVRVERTGPLALSSVFTALSWP